MTDNKVTRCTVHLVFETECEVDEQDLNRMVNILADGVYGAYSVNKDIYIEKRNEMTSGELPLCYIARHYDD